MKERIKELSKMLGRCLYIDLSVRKTCMEEKVPIDRPGCWENRESMSIDGSGCREDQEKAFIHTHHLAAGRTSIMRLLMDLAVGKIWTRCL